LGIFTRDDSPQNRRTPSTIRASAPKSPIIPKISGNAFSNLPLNVARPASYDAPRSLTASAVQIKVGDKGEAEQFRARRNAGSAVWQSEAWEYYDAIGEIKYAFNLVASIVSRVRLYPAVVANPSEAPSPIKNVDNYDQRLIDAAERAISRLDSAYGGQAGLLRDAALNLQVAGECYLVQIPARLATGTSESWDIRSIDEVVADQRGNYIIVPRRELRAGSASAVKNGSYVLPNNSFVGRIWKSHPRFTDEADSSLRGILDLCAELLLLNRTFRATARSRLNAGALYLPDGLSVAASPDPDYPFDEEGYSSEFNAEESADDFEDQLMDAMTTPIKDEDSASAVVPLIIRGPAELGDKIHQFKFERSFDPALASRSDRVLERILQGLDVPKDIVTGLANVKYSNALQIDESLYKAHIEPLMLLIADALTVMYMRPYLIANGFSELEVGRIVVWFDPTAVATRNDRAQDADSGFEKMAISYETWRRTHGFSELEAPSPTEVALRLLIEKGTITPELTQAMLGVVAPDVMAKVRESAQEASVAPVPPEVEELLGGQQESATEAPGSAETQEEVSAPSTQETPTPTATDTTTTTPESSAPPALAEPEDL
jgi:hypothetical protein